MKLSLIASAFALFTLAISSVDARFDQEEKSPCLKELEHFASGDVNGCLADLEGTTIDSLLAGAPPCAVQDQMDKVVDIAKSRFIKGSQKGKLISIARCLLVAEKNTPNKGQRSLDCNKAPRNKELRGLKRKQDPTKGPGSKLPPFKPKKFSTIKNLVCKINGKIIAPRR